MKILNKTTGKMVAEQYDVADTFLSRATGLMFARKKEKTIWFIFNDERIQPIHSVFVPQEFTAVYVDSKMRVVEVWKKVGCFKLYLAPKKPAKYLLESFKLKSIPKVGDVLTSCDSTVLKNSHLEVESHLSKSRVHSYVGVF